MRLKTSSLLKIDKLFLGVQRFLEGAFKTLARSRGQNSGHIIVLKLMGKGSIIRFWLKCEDMRADKNKITLITFEQHRDVCEWLQIRDVHYIRTTSAFFFVVDCWRIFMQAKDLSPKVVVNLERCSHAVSTFGLLLSWRGRCKNISFESEERLSDKVKIYSASQLTLEQIFEKCIQELPLTADSRSAEEIDVVENHVVVNVNASDFLLARRYSIESYAEVIRLLHQHNPDLQFILTGSASERQYVELLAQKLDNLSVRNLAGDLSLVELAEQFASASLVLTGDSMPLHLAAYLSVPVVALWGPTQPQHFGYSQRENVHSATLKLSCSPCFIHPASNPAKQCLGKINCLTDLKPVAVAKLCIEVIQKAQPVRAINFPAAAARKPLMQLS